MIEGGTMRFMTAVGCVVLAGVIAGGIWAQSNQSANVILTATFAGYAGSRNCRACHLSNPEHRPNKSDLAMHRFTAEFADSTLRPVNPPIQIGDTTYAIDLDEYGGTLVGSRPGGCVKYAIQYAAGGKHVYYFLTTLPDGHMQVLPLAFDLRTQRWRTIGIDLSPPGHALTGQDEHSRNRLLSLKAECDQCHRIVGEDPTDAKEVGMRSTGTKY